MPESKNTQFDVVSALPQALAYMLAAPNPETPVYGLLVNGREFVFIKPTFRTSNWHIGYLNEAIRITAIFSSMVLNS